MPRPGRPAFRMAAFMPSHDRPVRMASAPRTTGTSLLSMNLAVETSA